MARVERVLCDRCGADCEDGYRRIAATVGRKCDAAGSMNDECVYFDLCLDCLGWELQAILNGWTHDTALNWATRVQWIRKRRRGA